MGEEARQARRHIMFESQQARKKFCVVCNGEEHSHVKRLGSVATSIRPSPPTASSCPSVAQFSSAHPGTVCWAVITCHHGVYVGHVTSHAHVRREQWQPLEWRRRQGTMEPPATAQFPTMVSHLLSRVCVCVAKGCGKVVCVRVANACVW